MLIQEQHDNFNSTNNPNFHIIKSGSASIIFRARPHLQISPNPLLSLSSRYLSICSITVVPLDPRGSPLPHITVCSVYRSPSLSSDNNSVEDLVDWIQLAFAEHLDPERSLVIGGDFNASHTTWSGTLTPPPSDQRSKAGVPIAAALQSHPRLRILNKVGVPTRSAFGENQLSASSPSAIDLSLAVDGAWCCGEWARDSYRRRSDHYPLFFSCSLNPALPLPTHASPTPPPPLRFHFSRWMEVREHEYPALISSLLPIPTQLSHGSPSRSHRLHHPRCDLLGSPPPPFPP